MKVPAGTQPTRLLEPVESGGIQSPESLNLGGLQPGVGPVVVFQKADNPWIARGQKTDRPVRAEHQSSDSEGLEHHVKEGVEVVRLPVLVIGFSDHARDLAQDVGMLGEFPDLLTPRRQRAGPDERLRDMIEDEGLFGECADQFQSRRELLRIDEDVVAEVERPKS